MLPTLFDASSNAIAEAQACGLPVVTSDIPSVRAMVSEGSAILVDPQSEEQIAGAIGKLLADVELKEKMADAALAHARQFTLRHRAERILAWIDKKRQN